MGRAPCCDKANVKRGPWSPDEDTVLKNYVEQHGTGGNWISLPHKAGLKRCGKSCRLRWLNYLRPDIKHGGFTEEEDNAIYALYKNIGSRWSVIASRLPGRTDNDVKNYWNTKLKKKLLAEKTNSSNNIVKNNYVNLSYSYSCSPFGRGIKTESSNYSLSGFSSSNSHEESSAMPLMEADSGYNVVLQRFTSEPISFPASGFLDNTDLSQTANGYCGVSPSQEVSATSLPLDTSYISWSDNGGGDDSSSFLGDFSNGPSFDLLNGYDFQDNMPDPTLHYAPNYNYLLANSKSSQFQSLTY